MKIIYFLELDENGQILAEKEMGSPSKTQIEVTPDNYPQKNETDFNVSGQWLLLDELLEIDNQHISYFKDQEKEITWFKLPDKYVEEDYMIDYNSDDQCPSGIDVLIKEDGYPIGVVSGCNSIKQAKVNNNLDGHKYKGELGIKLNNQFFLSYQQENKEFKILKTSVDWDRGRRTI